MYNLGYMASLFWEVELVKPVVHIIGLGEGGLEKLSLGSYRLLAKADKVLVTNLNHPTVSDLLNEGISCEEILWDGDYKLILSEDSETVLALPGNPLPEGKLVSKLQIIFGNDVVPKTDALSPSLSIDRLSEIMLELRSEWGCPWDREQDHLTLKKYLIEEAYEVIDAIDSKNMNNLCEELGDLLLQVVFHACIAEESGYFNFKDVIEGISKKLVRRHPHVFDSVIVGSSEEVVANWDAIKSMEKSDESKNQTYFSIPKGLSALLFAQETQKEAGKVGFDWDSYEGPLAKVYEELSELKNEIESGGRIKEEMGDILFSIVNLSRFLAIDAEESLRQGTKKFQERFNEMVIEITSQRENLDKMSLEEMDIYWSKVKNKKNRVL